MRSSLRIYLAALILMTALGGIHTGADAQPQTGSLYGTLTAEDSPVPGVTLSVRSEATGEIFTTVSDARGRFRFVNLPLGRYHIEVSLEGFGTFSADSTVAPDRNTTLDIELVPASRPITGEIRGTVKNQARQPVGGAEVTLKGPDDQEKSTQTEEDGSYRQAGLRPGEWVVRVEARGYRPAQHTVQLREREDHEEDFILKGK